MPPVLAATTSGHGPAVVLLHGQPGSAGDWRAITPLLHADFTVVALDRPGYGRTGGPAGGFTANAAAVIATLDHLGVRRAVVVGHSWAGGVALTIAAHHPERVSGLVLVSSVGPDEVPRLVDRLLAARVLGDVVVASTFTVARTLLGSSTVRAGLARVLPGAGRTALSLATEGIDDRRAFRADYARPAAALWRSFMVEQRAFVDQIGGLTALQGQISTPCVVMVGSLDRVVAPEISAQLAAAIPGAELRSVADAGHLLPFDHPDEVADAVRTVACSGR